MLFLTIDPHERSRLMNNSSYDNYC